MRLILRTLFSALLGSARHKVGEHAHPRTVDGSLANGGENGLEGRIVKHATVHEPRPGPLTDYPSIS